MKGPIDIYYDAESDFLEITILDPPKKSYCEDIDEDIFIRKDEDSDEVVGIGILNFKHHTTDLRRILALARIEVNLSQIPESKVSV